MNISDVEQGSGPVTIGGKKPFPVIVGYTLFGVAKEGEPLPIWSDPLCRNASRPTTVVHAGSPSSTWQKYGQLQINRHSNSEARPLIGRPFFKDVIIPPPYPPPPEGLTTKFGTRTPDASSQGAAGLIGGYGATPGRPSRFVHWAFRLHFPGSERHAAERSGHWDGDRQSGNDGRFRILRDRHPRWAGAFRSL